jgi:hypothetical protein
MARGIDKKENLSHHGVLDANKSVDYPIPGGQAYSFLIFIFKFPLKRNGFSVFRYYKP